MTESQQAWDDVAQQFRSLGRSLQERYREQAPSEREPADRGAVDAAVRTLTDAVETVIESVGAAVRDTEFRDQAKQAAQSLVDALGATVTDLGDDIRAGFPPRYEPPADSDAEGAAPAESGLAGGADEAEWEEPAQPEDHQPT